MAPVAVGAAAAPALLSVDQLVQTKTADGDDAVEKEAGKGYSIAFVGIDQPILQAAHRFEEPLQRLVATFDGPIVIAVNGEHLRGTPDRPLDILGPTGGRQEARLATEIALVLARASEGTLSVLHVFDPREDTDLLRGRARRMGMSVLVDAHRLGKRSGVTVKGLIATNAKPDSEIRKTARRGRYDLVVLGASLRQGDAKFLGPRTAALLRDIRTPILLVAC